MGHTHHKHHRQNITKKHIEREHGTGTQNAEGRRDKQNKNTQNRMKKQGARNFKPKTAIIHRTGQKGKRQNKMKKRR